MSDDVGSGDARASRTRGDAPPQVRRTGRGLAGFAIFLALVALGVAAYPYYQRAFGALPIESGGGIETLRHVQEQQASQLRDALDSTAAIEARLQQQEQQARGDGRDVFPSSVTRWVGAPAPESQRVLKLAEADYLLRSANDRLLVTRDVRGAMLMLLGAQSLIEQVDDASLSVVRAELVREIAVLRDAPGVDLGGAFARLEAVQRVVPDLPARGARFTPPPSEAPADPVAMTAWDSVWQRFHSLFEFRREGTAARPPLGSDEAAYLRLNLALMLQTAELALLRNDATVYQQSLGSVRQWLDDYLDTGVLAVAGVRAEVDQLLELRLDRPLPDISASLAALRPLLDAKPGPASTPAVPQAAVDAVEQAPAAREAPAAPVEPGDGQ